MESRKHPSTRDEESPQKKLKSRAVVSNEDESEDEAQDESHPALPDQIVSYEENNFEDSDGHIETPMPDDILLGRGKPFQNHLGNQRMLKIVSEYKDQYNSEKRENRRAFAEQVLDVIYEKGARFLKRVDGETNWETVNREVSFDKVSHALRSKVKKNKPQKFPGEATDQALHQALHQALPESALSAASGQANQLYMMPPTGLPTVLYPSLVHHPAIGLVPALAPVMYAPAHPLLGHHLLHQNSLGSRSIYDDIAVENMVRAQMDRAQMDRVQMDQAQMDQARMADFILRRRRLLDDASKQSNAW